MTLTPAELSEAIMLVARIKSQPSAWDYFREDLASDLRYYGYSGPRPELTLGQSFLATEIAGEVAALFGVNRQHAEKLARAHLSGERREAEIVLAVLRDVVAEMDGRDPAAETLVAKFPQPKSAVQRIAQAIPPASERLRQARRGA